MRPKRVPLKKKKGKKVRRDNRPPPCQGHWENVATLEEKNDSRGNLKKPPARGGQSQWSSVRERETCPETHVHRRPQELCVCLQLGGRGGSTPVARKQPGKKQKKETKKTGSRPPRKGVIRPRRPKETRVKKTGGVGMGG